MKFNKKVVMIMSIFISLVLLYFGFVQYQIYKHSQQSAPKNADYMVVLGARVKGTVPSLVLEERIQSAAIYLKKNKNTLVIASGGQGPGEDISEALCIKNELVKLGISESRILLEDQSTDTYENIQFSLKHIPEHAKIGLIVTNDFHLYRAGMIAKDNALVVSGIPASTPLIAIPKSYTREYLAITKYYLKRLKLL
jgi:uncharacterized SAM-binding protein YcdF (DUF218 family)